MVDVTTMSVARALLDAVGEVACLLDSTGRLVLVNTTWERVSADAGVAPDQWIGRNYIEICRKAAGPDAEYSGEALRCLESVLRGQSDEERSVYPCRVAGETHWFELRAAMVDNAMLRCMVTHKDITDQELRRQDAGMALEALTPRQRDVARLIAKGQTTQQIANALDVSVNTVNNHRRAISKRIGTGSQAKIARYILDADTK